MAAKSMIVKGMIASLAVATSLTALPSTALAAPGDRQGQAQWNGGGPRGNGGGGGWNNGGSRGNGGQRDWAQSRPQAQQPRAEAPRANPRSEAPRTAWQGRGNADAAPRWGGNQGPRTTAPTPPAATPVWRNNRPETRADNGGKQPAWRAQYENRRDDRTRDWNRDRDNKQPAWRDQRASRDNDRDGDRWRGNNGWRGDNGWRGNEGWRGNTGWRSNDGWRGNNGWRPGTDYRRWDNHGWRRDTRYDWSGWRSRNRSVFHGGYYYAPYRNYSYSRISIGFNLGSPFYADQYLISDPWRYRLPAAYGPYRWVRYYDDVMLVDTYTGEVVDVIYDFFW